MKIKEIRFEKVNLDLVRPYTIAYKTISHVENLVVEVVLENGMYGLGTSNPSKLVVGENVDDAYQTFENDYPDFLIGRDIRHLHQLCFEVNDKYKGKVGLIAALDIALYDVFTKMLNISLVDFLGRKVEQLPTSITIGIMNVADTLQEAQEYFDRKFKILKVKLGNELEEDIERLVKLREKFGNSMKIRIDANQGYSVEQLLQFHQKTQHLEIELVEQPLPASQIDEMKHLPTEIKETIAADESLLGPTSALSLIDVQKACGIFNIKLMKCGGISNALAIAQIAHYADIYLMWGCNDESIVSISAALHLAFSSSKTKYIDLDGSLDLAKDIAVGGFIINEGMMYPNYGVGLGVEKLG